MNIGERIKSLREQKGLSQRELSEVIGIGQTAVSAWERSVSIPPDDLKKRIADYFQITVSELIGADPIVVEKEVEKIVLVEQPKDQVKQLIERLIEEKIITDPDNIPEPVVKIILDAVRADLRMKQLRK